MNTRPPRAHWRPEKDLSCPLRSAAVDSRGTVYTTDVDSGKRAQKFLNKGRG